MLGEVYQIRCSVRCTKYGAQRGVPNIVLSEVYQIQYILYAALTHSIYLPLVKLETLLEISCSYVNLSYITVVHFVNTPWGIKG